MINKSCEIMCNGATLMVSQDATLSELVSELALEGKRIAIEVNETIVPKGEHAQYILKSGDTVEIIHAIGGG